MAGGMKIPIDVNLAQVRKSFREMTKLQKKTWKVRQKQIRVEKKESKQELKRIAKEHKAKQKFMKEESTHTKRQRDDRGKFIKREESHTRKTRRESAKDFRTTNDRIRKIDRQSKKGFGRRAGGMAIRGGAMAAGGLLGFAVGYGLKAAEMRKQAHQSFGPSIGSGASFGDAMKMRSKGRVGNYKGGNLGFNVMQRSGMIPGMTRATGSTNVAPMMEAMRATGMNQGEVGGSFGAIRAGGTQFGGGKGKREFKEILAAGMASGLEKGRMPEFMSGVTSLMQSQQAMSAGDVGSGGIAKLAAALGQSGKSGFKGSRGMKLMGKLQQGILQPGGGESGMAFMRQAFGFGKPGGGASFYEAEKSREGGLGKNAEGFSRVMGEVKSQYGTGEDAVLKMREVLGTSISQGEELIRLSEEGNLSAQNLERIDEIMKETEPIEKQAARAMKEAGTILKKIAGRMDQSVGNGAAAQKILDKIEDFQKMLYELMLKWIPKIASILSDIKAFVKLVWDWLRAKFGNPLKETAEGIGNIIKGKAGIKSATAAAQSGKRFGNKKFKDISVEKLQSMALASSGKKRMEIEQELRDRTGFLEAASVADPGAINVGATRKRSRMLARQASHGNELYEAQLAGKGLTHRTATPQQRAQARTTVNMGLIPAFTKKGQFDKNKAVDYALGGAQRKEAAIRMSAYKSGDMDLTEMGEGAAESNAAAAATKASFQKGQRDVRVVIEDPGADPGRNKSVKNKGGKQRKDAGSR